MKTLGLPLENDRITTAFFLLLLLLMAVVVPVYAQDGIQLADEEVDAIIAALYYSDGTALETCATSECEMWRGTIRTLAAEGKNREDIIYEFVGIFGYKVLGVTDNEVNAIAAQLYCPVCENIPLDACPTVACRDWRNEVGIYLFQGMTEDEIKSDFVDRFGDRVVGTPQDPLLRAISLITPWVLVGLMLFAAVRTYLRWRGQQTATDEVAPITPSPEIPAQDSDYLSRLEQDLAE